MAFGIRLFANIFIETLQIMLVGAQILEILLGNEMKNLKVAARRYGFFLVFVLYFFLLFINLGNIIKYREIYRGVSLFF